MLLVLLCVICFLYSVWTWRTRTHPDPNIPPYLDKLYPIVGHTHIFFGGSAGLWQELVQISKASYEKGGVVRSSLGFQDFYIITDPEDILTASNGCLKKYYAYEWAKPWLGNGLLTSSGPIWKRHRQLIIPAFSAPILHGFLGIFNNQAKILVNKLSNEVGKGSFNISPYTIEYSWKSFCMTAFGVEIIEDEKFLKNYTQAVDTILGFFMTKFTKFWLHSDIMYELLGFKQKQDEIVTVLNNMCDTIIRKKRATLNHKDPVINDPSDSKRWKHKPLMDLLLELSDNNALSDEEIREEVNTFVVAAYETSSLTIAYTLILLGTYPEIQDRVYKEIQSAFGDSDRDLEKTDLSQLTYTEAVLKETLRLYPIAPALLRTADKDVQLKKYRIPTGANVLLMLYAQNRNPAWGVDANEFRPERWLHPDPLHTSAFGSFSVGKRSCIGKHYALMTMKTVIVHIIRHYRIMADASELKLKIDILLKPVAGCNISLERRN